MYRNVFCVVLTAIVFGNLQVSVACDRAGGGAPGATTSGAAGSFNGARLFTGPGSWAYYAAIRQQALLAYR